MIRRQLVTGGITRARRSGLCDGTGAPRRCAWRCQPCSQEGDVVDAERYLHPGARAPPSERAIECVQGREEAGAAAHAAGVLPVFEGVVPVASPDQAFAREAIEKRVDCARGLVDVAALAPRVSAAGCARAGSSREGPAASRSRERSLGADQGNWRAVLLSRPRPKYGGVPSALRCDGSSSRTAPPGR